MILRELFHQMAWLPLLVVAITHLLRDDPPSSALWFVAAGLAVSGLADMVAQLHGPNNLFIMYLYPIPQAGLIVFGLRGYQRPTVALGFVALLSLAMTGPGRPDVLLGLVAAGVVLLAVHGYPKGWLRSALWVYFGLGTLWWASWAFTLGTGTAFLVSYYGYQGSRLVGIGLATVAMCRYPKTRPRLA